MTRMNPSRLTSLSALLLALFVGLFALPNRSCAQSEEGIKAAFIYNFARLTEWPSAVFKDSSTPVVIGFVGGEPLAHLFEQAVKGKDANGRDFSVVNLPSAAGAAECQIVYVADASKLADVLAAVKGKPVLVVAEGREVIEVGGMIRFERVGPKVLFDINLDATAAVGLKIDGKLLKIARKVKGS